MAVDTYSNYDDFKLKKPFSFHGLNKNNLALYGSLDNHLSWNSLICHGHISLCYMNPEHGSAWSISGMDGRFSKSRLRAT